MIVRTTGEAAAFPPFPAWLAVTTQFPAIPTRVSELPLTVHTEAGVALKVTVSPLGLAVAVSARVPASGATGAG